MKKNNNFLKVISPQVLYDNFGFGCIDNIPTKCSWIYKDIEHITFSNSNNELEEINFSSTQIVDNRSECIDNVKDVKHNIKNIPNNLINYTNLKILNLSDNNIIDSITKNNLEQIKNKNLEEIYLHNTEKYQKKLGGNNLTKITDNIFKLSNLSILNISGNNIQTLPQKINDLKNLKNLNLSNNQITTIPDTISLSNLEELNLSNNKITNFPIFTTPNIKKLYLNNNEITNFTENFLELLGIINHNSLDINISFNNINENFPGYDPGNRNFNDNFIQSIIEKCLIFNIKSNFFSGEVSCDLAGQFGYDNLTQKTEQLETNPKTCTISEKLENKLLYRPEINYEMIHATPTLFHAGTPFQQLCSCFLNTTPDSVEGIFDTFKNVALLSKWAGGVGQSISDLRSEGSYIRKTGGYSDGIMPFLKTENGIARYINQSGRRLGSFAMYIEPWHADIIKFLHAKKNHGNEEERARDLFYGLWIPDCFMKAVEKDENWYLMCPDECQNLTTTFGDEFEELYYRYVSEGKFRREMKARELFLEITTSQRETGLPYMCYKDACNKKNNQKNLGTIKCSNLCTEIMEYSDEKEYAVCNLASISLSKCVKYPKVEYKRLKMYVLRSRVTIEDVSKTIHFYGIWFDAQEVNKIEPAFEHIKNISFFVIKDSSELKNRGWVLSDATSVSILEEKLKVLIPEDLKFRRASEDLWHMSEVMSGFTWINKSQADIYVPQFINLDIVDGLSFDKGCYPGQEVIARLHFLGKNKKRSILATLVDNTPKVLARLLSPTVLPTLHRSPIYLNDPKGTEDQIGEIVSVTKLMNLENSKVDNLLLLILINLNALAHSQTEKNIKFLAIINDVKFEVKFLKSFALYNLIIAEMHRA